MTQVLGRLIGEDIELVINLAPDLGHIRMDATQFEQIFVNLVLNASDAMPNGGKLRIEASNEDRGPQRVRITVTDTGCGMAPEVLLSNVRAVLLDKTQRYWTRSFERLLDHSAGRRRHFCRKPACDRDNDHHSFAADSGGAWPPGIGSILGKRSR